MKEKQTFFIRKMSLLIAAVFVTANLWAQLNISGKVVDKDGQALPGVTVRLQQTTSGTSTDMDGSYNISAPEDGVLEFSFVGMISVTEEINGRSIINVSMQADAIGLEEIVAIGYGTMKKSDLTGSVTSVNSSQFDAQPLTQMDQALRGRAAGVQVTQTSGKPGSAMKIRIRGTNSITGSNEPLYIIDGIVAPDITSINVNDIESIEVLKDASATAIYGSRGANGVILITSKTGERGKSTMSFETFRGVSKVIQKLPTLSPAAYAEGVNFTEKAEWFSAEEIEALRQPGAGVDVQDEMFVVAPSQNYQLTFSGGSNDVDYYISGNVFNAEGTLLSQNYKRYTLRANVNAKVSEKASIGLRVHGSREETTGVRMNLPLSLTWDMTTPFYNDEGGYNFFSIKPGVGQGLSSQFIAAMEKINDDYYNRANANGYLNLDLLKGLVLNISGGVNWMNRTVGSYEPNLLTPGAIASVQDNDNTFLQNVNRLTYNFEDDQHKFQIDAIHEQQMSSFRMLAGNASGFFSDGTTYKNLALAEIQNIETAYYGSTLQSFLGRVNYSFDNKYLLTASLRADGSSKFRKENRWGYFPSASAAWRISEEKFMENISEISNLKLRLSYGVTGSQAIEVFATRSRPLIGLEYNYPFDAAAMYIGAAPSARMANPDLTWESTVQGNIGVDLGLWDNRITLSADVYKKRTSDLLLDVSLPQFVGPTVMAQNVGEMENKGFEFVLGWVAVDNKDLQVSNTLTFNRNVNKILALVSDEPVELGPSYADFAYTPVNPTRLEVGNSMGAFRGYKFLGVWQADEAEEAAKYNRVPGQAKYADLNEDFNYTPDDMDYIGNGYPDFTFGLNGDVSYKNFGLNYLFTGSVGNDIYNFLRARMMSVGTLAYHASHADFADRWTEDNPSDIPSTREGAELLTSQYLEDGSFFTLKNLSLSYTFENVAAFKAIGLDALKIYGSVENLFIVTKYRGYDPETTVTGNSDVAVGIDMDSYPLTRTLTAGIKLTF